MKKSAKLITIIILLILLVFSQSFQLKVFADAAEIEGGVEGDFEGDDEDVGGGYTGGGSSGSSIEAKDKTLDDVLGEADAFLKLDEGKGENLLNIKDTSNLIYNVLLAIGMIIAVIVGITLGIKFMISTSEEKAKIKKTLVPYFVGCVILFGAFGIWKSILVASSNITAVQDSLGEQYLPSIIQGNTGSDEGSEEYEEWPDEFASGNNVDPSNQIPVTKITLNKINVSVDSVSSEKWHASGGKTQTVTHSAKTDKLTASVEPSNASNKNLKWEIISGKQIIKLTNPDKSNYKRLITGRNGGTATIKVSSKSNPNVYATCKVTVLHALYENVKLTSKVTVQKKYSKNEKITLKSGTKVELLGTLKTLKGNDVTIRYQNELFVVNAKYLKFVSYHIDTYQDSVFTNWVNNYNPSSDTKYFIWANLGSLRLMFFERKNGQWKMIENEGCSPGDLEGKNGYGTGIHFDMKVRDFDVDSENPSLGRAIHMKLIGTGAYFGNTIHIGDANAIKNKKPSTHGCPSITASFRDYLYKTYGNKLINSRAVYF